MRKTPSFDWKLFSVDPPTIKPAVTISLQKNFRHKEAGFFWHKTWSIPTIKVSVKSSNIRFDLV